MKYKKAKFIAFNADDYTCNLTVGKSYKILKFYYKDTDFTEVDAFEIKTDSGYQAYCLVDGCAFGKWEMIP